MSDRLIRALQRGGRLAPVGEGWGVWRNGDLRARRIGVLSRSAVAAMERDGQLASQPRDGKDILVWTGPGPKARMAGPALSEAASPDRKRRSGLEVILAALGCEREQALARAALSRLEGDLERAASGQRITQNWDMSLRVDGVTSRRGGGRMESALRAQARIDSVRAILGTGTLTLVWQVALQGRSLAMMASERAMSRAELVASCADALRALCEAYRLHVPAAR